VPIQAHVPNTNLDQWTHGPPITHPHVDWPVPTLNWTRIDRVDCIIENKHEDTGTSERSLMNNLSFSRTRNQKETREPITMKESHQIHPRHRSRSLHLLWFYEACTHPCGQHFHRKAHSSTIIAMLSITILSSFLF
jgi:hypothetical protein